MTSPETARRGRRATTAALVVATLATLLLAAALALARVLAPTQRWGIELVSFTPVGAPVALLGLVAGLALVRRHAFLARSTLVVAVGLALIHASWLAPRFVADAPAADPDGPRLVVMTQNFEEGDAAEVVDLVEQYAVDVLVLTDAPEAQVQAMVDADIGQALAHTTGNGPGSVVWSRFPLTSDVLISDGGDSRIVRIDIPGLAEVDVVALHPTPPYQAGGSLWQADWERVLSRVRETYGQSADGRVLVAGDLNATLDHWPVRSLHDLGFRDTSEQLGSGLSSTWPANGAQTRLGVTVPPLLALDHVLTSPGLVPVEEVLTDRAGSDHLGLIVTLGLPAR